MRILAALLVVNNFTVLMWWKKLLRDAVVFLKGKFSISFSPIFQAFSSFSLFLEYCLHGYSPNQYVLAGWGNNCVLKSQKSFALSGI